MQHRATKHNNNSDEKRETTTKDFARGAAAYALHEATARRNVCVLPPVALETGVKRKHI